MNIIEWLNTNFDAGDAMICGLIALVVWIILWKLLVCKILEKCNPGSFGYGLSELGAVGCFGVLVFFLIIAVLLVASVQAVITYGIKMLFAVLLFWGGIIAVLIFIIKKVAK